MNASLPHRSLWAFAVAAILALVCLPASQSAAMAGQPDGPVETEISEAKSVVVGRAPYQKTIYKQCGEGFCKTRAFTVPKKSRIEITHVSCHMGGALNLKFAYFILNNAGRSGTGYAPDNFYPEYQASDGGIGYSGFNTQTLFIAKAGHQVFIEMSGLQIVSGYTCKLSGEIVTLK